MYEIDEKEETESVSFKDDFFFLTWSGRVLTRNNTLRLGEAYNRGLKVLDNTLIACGKKCGEFDFSGNALWDTYIGWTDSSPDAFEDYIYVADHNRNSLLIIRKGKVVNKIKYNEGAWSVALCNKTLAVTTDTSLFIYRLEDPERPEELIALNGFGLAWRPAFSKDCNALAVLDRFKRNLLIVNNDGKVISTVSTSSDPTALDWGENLVVGQFDGTVMLYDIKMNKEVDVLLNFENVFYFHEHKYPILVLPTRSKYAEVEGKRYAVMEGHTPLGPFEGLKSVKLLDEVETIVYVGVPRDLNNQEVVETMKELKVPLFEGAVVEVDGYDVVVERIKGALSAWPSSSLIIPRPLSSKGKVKVARVRSWTTG